MRASPPLMPVDIEFIGDRVYVGSIGDLLAAQASAARPAHIAAAELVDNSIAGAEFEVVVDNLYRMAGGTELARGQELASQFCTACHLATDPSILPKRSWEAALGYMGYWLGMENLDYLDDRSHPGASNAGYKHLRPW